MPVKYRYVMIVMSIVTKHWSLRSIYKTSEIFALFRKFDLSICSSGDKQHRPTLCGLHKKTHYMHTNSHADFTCCVHWAKFSGDTSKCVIYWKLSSFMFSTRAFSGDLKLIYWIIYLWDQQQYDIGRERNELDACEKRGRSTFTCTCMRVCAFFLLCFSFVW